MPRSNAILFVKLDPPDTRVKEFNDWYNNRHIPDRLALPGVFSARRYTLTDFRWEYSILPEARYLALYDLKNVKVLLDKPYNELREREFKRPPDSFEFQIFKLTRFTRAVYEQIYPEKGSYTYPGTKFTMVVGHDVPKNRHQEFNAWYNTEHIPALMSVPGFRAVRRFRLDERQVPPLTDRGGTVSQYMTIWDVESESALAGEEFANAANSRWSDWVRSWYTRKICVLYRQIFP